MKKIFTMIVLSMALYLLSGCNDNQGTFPEFDESHQVFMSSEEVVSLLSSIDGETQLYEVMLLSIDLDISVKEEFMDIWTYTKISENTADIKLQSKTYISLAEDISEVQLISNNQIDAVIKSTHMEDESLNEEETITGTVDAYFSNQNIYYDADVKGGSAYIDNGKYKINVGITQAMWDEIYSDTFLDDYADVDSDLVSSLNDQKMINTLFATEMIRTYQNGDETIVVLDLEKQELLEHANQILNSMYDTSTWTNTDYIEHKYEIFDQPLSAFEFFDTQIAIVIKDNQITKIGCDIYMYSIHNREKVEISGRVVFDMFAEMPKMPGDLEDYELTDLPLEILF